MLEVDIKNKNTGSKVSKKLSNYFLIFIIAMLITYFLLYKIGNLGMVVAYKHSSNLPSIKLEVLRTLLVVVATISNFYILVAVRKLNKAHILLFCLTLVLSFILAVFSMGILGYEKTGNYLRDVHGINWYFMDMANWMITMTIFFMSVYTAVVLIFLRRKLKYIQKHR